MIAQAKETLKCGFDSKQTADSLVRIYGINNEQAMQIVMLAVIKDVFLEKFNH